MTNGTPLYKNEWMKIVCYFESKYIPQKLVSSYGAQESVTKPKEKKFIGLIDANDLQIEY